MVSIKWLPWAWKWPNLRHNIRAIANCYSQFSLSLSLSHLFSLCSRPDTESIRNENIDPLLSLAQTTPPEDSSASDRTEPAVLLLPPLTALPVDTLNTFNWPLLLPVWGRRKEEKREEEWKTEKGRKGRKGEREGEWETKDNVYQREEERGGRGGRGRERTMYNSYMYIYYKKGKRAHQIYAQNDKDKLQLKMVEYMYM